MPANYTTILNMVMEHIKSSDIYGVYQTNPNFQLGYIQDEIRKANDDVVAAICSNPANSRRVDFVTQQAVTALVSGDKIPSSIGGITNVRIKRSDDVVVLGKYAAFDWVDCLRTINHNALDIADKEGYYAIVGTEIYFSGATAGVSFCSPPAAIGTVLTAPVEYEAAIRDLSLSRLYMKHEDKPASATHYGNLAMGIIQAVKGGQEIPANV